MCSSAENALFFPKLHGPQPSVLYLLPQPHGAVPRLYQTVLVVAVSKQQLGLEAAFKSCLEECLLACNCC